MNESEVENVEKGAKGVDLDYALTKGSWLPTLSVGRIEIKHDLREPVAKRVKVLSLGGPSIIITSAGDMMRMISVPVLFPAVGRGVEPVDLIGLGAGEEVESQDERILALESAVKAMWTDEEVDAAVKIAMEPDRRFIKVMTIVLVMLIVEIMIVTLMFVWVYLL